MKTSLLLLSCVYFAHCDDDIDIDIGPDTCGRDRKELSQWFMDRGSTDLILDPVPPLVQEVTKNPYKDPTNPPIPPEEISGFCGMAWDSGTDPDTGLRNYRLKNFTTLADVEEAGYNVTHCGHCGACSGIQVLLFRI